MLGHILKRTLLLVYVILTHLTHRLTQLLWICHSQNLIVLIIYNRWIVSKNVDCKLETIWNQGSPFNDLCPKVGWFKREKAPAGCVPIAVGQIVAYHEYPNLICNGVKIDYSLLKAVRNIHDVDNSEDSLGIAKNYIRFLSSRNACDVYYGKIFGISFGFALPSKAKSTFDLLGYNNVNLKWGYNENTVMKSLDSGCPVLCLPWQG